MHTKHIPGSRSARAKLLGVLASLLLLAQPAAANGFGENAPWGFQTSEDKVNKGAVLDLIERKRGGYYDSFRSTTNITNNTYIRQQVNCNVSAAATGNSGSNGMTASTSSPNVSSSGNTSANTTGNAASNAAAQDTFGWMGANGPVDNTQNNSGQLNSSVSGSTTSSSTGAVNAGGGHTSQALNSSQDNGGTQTASVSDSTACSGPMNAN